VTDRNLHPTADELAAYHAGELPPAEEDAIQEHLLGCRECTDLLLALDELHRPEEGEPVPAGELDAVWEGLQARLPPREEIPAPAPLPFASPASPRPPSSSPRWLQALAASLAVGVIGLSFWALSLRRTVDELSRPQLNAPVEDLFPGPVRGGTAAQDVVEIAPGTRFFTLVLPPAREGSFEDYEVEIARAGGPAVWRGRGLRENRYGSFSLTLSRRLVGEGEYRIRLFGIGAGGREEVGTYSLRVR
jgi:Putative zinc-finger